MTVLVRGKYLLSRIERDRYEVMEDGALAVESGFIRERGRFEDLRARYPTSEILGSTSEIVIPGLVNSHHHVGLTPTQLGAPDLPLELWNLRRATAPIVDPYLDTLYSAFEMVQSGVTTVQHIHGRGLAGNRAERRKAVADVLRAYSDVGMRVTYSFSVRDQNRIVYGDDDAFIGTLPVELAAKVRRFYGPALPIDEQFDFFIELWERTVNNPSPLMNLQLSPANLLWCSDATLLRAKSLANRYGIRLHIHALETRYQREYARRNYGTTGVRHLQELGILDSQTTLAHAVWITDADADLIARSGACVCHNASSNLRLGSGVAPVEQLVAKHVPVAIGIDEAGINDDRDMLQEMRLVLDLHHAIESPGQFEGSLSASRVLHMATQGGATSTGFVQVGTLEPGQAADLVLIDWHAIEQPYLDAATPVVDAFLRRARPAHVRSVLVAGEPIFAGGGFTRVDKDNLIEELASKLRFTRTSQDSNGAAWTDAILPHVKRFYDGWLSSETLHGNDP